MKSLTPQTVYIKTNKETGLSLLNKITDTAWDDMNLEKQEGYFLSKEELSQVITDAIHWGVGTYQEQLAGGSPTNSQIQYYLSEKLS